MTMGQQRRCHIVLQASVILALARARLQPEEVALGVEAHPRGGPLQLDLDFIEADRLATQAAGVAGAAASPDA